VGQEFSVYTTTSTGLRRETDLDDPREYHVVLLDNGRSALRGSEDRDMLRYRRALPRSAMQHLRSPLPQQACALVRCSHLRASSD
jgi:hypothetical protein